MLFLGNALQFLSSSFFSTVQAVQAHVEIVVVLGWVGVAMRKKEQQ